MLSVDCPWVERKRNKMKRKIVTLAITALCLSSLIGCAFQRSGPNLSSPAYVNASPENKDRIARGKISIGMTIDECRAAWPNKHFQYINGYQTRENNYEIYQVETYSEAYNTMLWLYLHLKNGEIIDISESRKR